MKVRLEKLEEVPNARHPNNIEIGYVETGEFIENPEIGEPFYVGHAWRTSRVEEIIDDSTFRTLNSIYKWELID